MTNKDKKLPAYEDLDKIEFGKYKGTPLQDVPSSYLLWLYDQMLADRDRLTPTRQKLFNYIHNSMDALKMENKDRV